MRLRAARAFAFVLPQFHAIPENDEWWGEGFTEWTNVRPARPLFPGHYQPHVPRDLGYYDLRKAATRKRMAVLASHYGLEGFCYYHYWFHGEQLLEAPFEAVLRSGDPDLPFCLCWANEAWTRRWDGSDDDILQPQRYSEQDDIDHITALLPALTDRRAISIDGCPIFLVYRTSQLPDAARTAQLWRQAATGGGLPGLHLVAVETDEPIDPRPIGFDASLRFQPDWRALDEVPLLPIGPPTARVYDYKSLCQAVQQAPDVPWTRYPAVCPGWDNTPRRRSGATVLHRSTPRKYERWLSRTLEELKSETPERRLLFINGWNEWGEGCHLEPDRRYGHAYLRATRRVLTRASSPDPDSDPAEIPSQTHPEAIDAHP